MESRSIGRFLCYAAGVLSLVSGLAAGGIGVILATLFWGSHVASDQRWGLFIGAVALALPLLAVAGIRCLWRGRVLLGWVLCGVSLLLSSPALLVLPGAIEAAARP